MELKDLCDYLDEFLHVGEFDDYPGAFNGLQLEREGEVKRIAAAVDACLFTIEAAARTGADLLLVHHGLLWGGLGPVTGPRYRRVAAAVKANLGLYSSHLPLDAHPEVGNNACLVKAMGFEPAEPFAEHKGSPIGFLVECDLDRSEWAGRAQTAVGSPVRLFPFGPERIRRFGVVSGEAASDLDAARQAGCDALLTGDASHYHYFEAEERDISLCLAGHYATEVFGVKALAAHLAEKHGLESSFIEHHTGL